MSMLRSLPLLIKHQQGLRKINEKDNKKHPPNHIYPHQPHRTICKQSVVIVGQVVFN